MEASLVRDLVIIIGGILGLLIIFLGAILGFFLYRQIKTLISSTKETVTAARQLKGEINREIAYSKGVFRYFSGKRT